MVDFDDLARERLTAALRSSRFDPLRLVNAPTAACIGRGLLNSEPAGDDERLLVVVDGDAGGLEADVSLLLLEDGVFEVMAVRRIVSPTRASLPVNVAATVSSLLDAVPVDSLLVTVRLRGLLDSRRTASRTSATFPNS